MKKGLSYDEEMTLLLELTDNMDDGDRECFTLEDADVAYISNLKGVCGEAPKPDEIRF